MIKLYIEENPNLKINKAKIDEILKDINLHIPTIPTFYSETYTESNVKKGKKK